MKFTIDTDEIKKLGIPKEVFFHVLYLYFCFKENKEVPIEANKLGYNIKDVTGYSINKNGVQLIEKVLMNSENKELKSDTEYEKLAQSLMKLFPEGRKPGTHKMWRGSIEEVIDKLRLLEYKAQISIEEDKAVQATMEYIKDFEDNQFMQTLPYFLFKSRFTEDEISDWSSNFLSILENMPVEHYSN